MKKTFMIVTLFLFHNVYAQNVIYKCLSSTGEITYQNNVGDKKECTKTNFASYPSINFFKSDAPKKLATVNSKSSGVKEVNIANSSVNEEQRLRDGKRSVILGQELSQEKEQLITVSEMLKNLKEVKSNDSGQINQLEELKLSHVNNITAIERELGSVKQVAKQEELKIEKANIQPNLNNQTMMVTTAIKPSFEKLLPMSLPQSLPDLVPALVLKRETLITSNKDKDKETNYAKKELPDTIALNIEKRKANRLRTNLNVSSGLSSMSKIKE